MQTEAKYIVEFQEHDSTPWRIDGVFTRANAWKRIKMCAANLVPGWPHPVWARVYLMKGENETLVYSCDLSQWTSAHSG